MAHRSRDLDNLAQIISASQISSDLLQQQQQQQ
jgi:hypothetical protein